jgi:hypothetical protein
MSDRYNIDPPPAADDELAEIQQTSLSELEAKLRIEKYREEVRDSLQCCLCSAPSDRRLIILAAQITLSTLILLFSFFKLSSSGEDDNDTVYITLVSTTFSYWTGRSSSSDAKP